jgi:GTP-binding protein YchF
MKLAIIGKPQSGKTTIFNAVAGQQEAVGDFSKAVHRALVKVPDPRLDRLAELTQPRKVTHAAIEFLDAPGLSGKGKQAGAFEIGEDFRLADAFLMVIDAFTQNANPLTDISTLSDELILFDHVLIDGIIEKRERKIKLTGDKTGLKELDLLNRCLEMLEQGKPLLDFEPTDEEMKLLRGFHFLSQKPLLIVLNVAEKALPGSDALVHRFADLISTGRRNLAVVCGQIEAELVDLQDEERRQFMSELGIAAPATEQVIQRAYALLGLISFLTVGEPDAHAWPIRKGTVAHQAAGVVHTDMERGFIRAEVVAFDDYDRLETMAAIKAAGKMKLEGKNYVVQDGDVILFRFNI